MSANRNKLAEAWAAHEPKLRAALLEHIAELADRADRDAAEDFAERPEQPSPFYAWRPSRRRRNN